MFSFIKSLIHKEHQVPDPCPYCSISKHEFDSLKDIVKSVGTRSEFVLLAHPNGNRHGGEKTVAEWQRLSQEYKNKKTVYSQGERTYWGFKKERNDTHSATLIEVKEL